MNVMVAGANGLSSSLACRHCHSWQVSRSVQPQCGCSVRLWSCGEQPSPFSGCADGKQRLVGATIVYVSGAKSCLGIGGRPQGSR